MKWTEPAPLRSTAILPDMHPVVARVLLQRGLATRQAVNAFIDPQTYLPTSASQLPGLVQAVERLEFAIRRRQSICVWGDFDVDGQTSTTILYQTLHDLGAQVTFHIPVRDRESHGVNLPILQEVINQGAQLILTCDTGITANPAVDYAHSRGVDMIVTDHHDLPPLLPSAFAIVNPKLLPEGHLLATLSGAGVAYKLSEELCARFGCPELSIHHLDLTALGLVGDLAALTGDTRYLVQLGLVELRHTHRLGLQVMLEMAELNPANLTEEHIGFVLGPRLNALGRLADANPAVELLTTSDGVRARVLATQLEGLNSQRQLLCNQVTRAAEAQLLADPALLAQPVLLLAHPSWPAGVIGIVASRLVDRYRKPAILFSSPPGQAARGSARSVEGINISAAIAAQKDLLINFGGHPMAAGLAIEPDKLPEFARRLEKTITEMQGAEKIEPELEIDGWLSLPDANLELAKALEILAPYGHGNERLTFATHGVKIQSSAAVGRNREHLKIKVVDEANNSRTVFWWNGAEQKDSLPVERINLAYSLRASDWRGVTEVQMELEDFQSIEEKSLEIQTRQMQIIDYRNSGDPLEILATLQRQPSTMLWAEGKEKQKVDGVGRADLAPAEHLIIWTIPPSAAELFKALEIVQPEYIYLFANTDASHQLGPFLEQVAGLLKYAINHVGGRISYATLECMTAQRPETIRKALRWLVSSGKINLIAEDETGMVVSIPILMGNSPELSPQLEEVRALLQETAAYRNYFQKADKDLLFQK